MLNTEWNSRLEAWRGALKKQLYRPLGPVHVSGFVTREQLTPQQALRRTFKPMPPRTTWGAKWEYAWLRAQISVPKSAAGQRIIAYPVAQESVAFVNGTKAYMTGDNQPLLLTRRAKGGDKFHVLIEAYAGHGPWPCKVGPVAPDRITVPEPPAKQAVVGGATFGIWQEDVYQLSVDVQALVGLMTKTPSTLLRTTQVEEALKDFTLIVDFEQSDEEFLASCRAARKRIAPLLACQNGSTMPVMYCFGHAHLDTAWVWPLQHSERKAARSLANQLQLLEEYPEHRFLFSQPAQYVWLMEKYPELYVRIKKAIAAGQIIPDGAMWVESDTNIPSGESLIRQFIHGKRFFREQFGVDSQLFWEPDAFGYSGALPQIMRGCGVSYFSTQKIFGSDVGNGDPHPYNNYTWEGIDGSTVLAFNHMDYTSPTSTDETIIRWHWRRQRDNIDSFLFPFGWGDGGGGPERDHLEFIRRHKDLEGVPKMKLAAPIEFFRDLERTGTPNRYVGELYFQNHRGTYTSQARTKRGNRQSEIAMHEAELWGAIAAATTRHPYPLARMDAVWKEILLNQFHDIIPGSSIQRVHEEAEAAHRKIVEQANAVSQAARLKMTKTTKATKGSITVFNSLGWERTALVEVPVNFSGTIQKVAGKTLAEVTVPACGWTTVRNANGEPSHGVTANPRLLENDRLRVVFNKAGEIASLRDKQTGGELAAGPCNRFLMYKDVPGEWDAWNIDSMYEQQPVDIAAPARIEVITSGPLLGGLRVTRAIGQSQLTQDILLRRGSCRLDFVTVIDWQERHKLLKVAFPVNVHANEAIHEIQFGHVRRPTHRSRQYDATRFEVNQQRWTALAEEGRGCAVLNDCKYGVNVLGNSINLTLLRAPLAPAMLADRGRQGFTYSFFAWNGSLADSGIVREASELNVPVATLRGDAGQQSWFRIDAPNVIIDTVKPAEDGSSDVIVRLYESMRTATRCMLKVGLPYAKVFQTNTLEAQSVKLAARNGAIALEFRPFEVKTVRLQKK